MKLTTVCFYIAGLATTHIGPAAGEKEPVESVEYYDDEIEESDDNLHPSPSQVRHYLPHVLVLFRYTDHILP